MMKRFLLAAALVLLPVLAFAQKPLLLDETAVPGLPAGSPLVGPPTCTLPDACKPVAGVQAVCNVRDHGAKGDFSTDDFAAFYFCENLNSGTGTLIVIPPAPGGVYCIKSTIVINQITKIEGITYDGPILSTCETDIPLFEVKAGSLKLQDLYLICKGGFGSSGLPFGANAPCVLDDNSAVLHAFKVRFIGGLHGAAVHFGENTIIDSTVGDNYGGSMWYGAQGGGWMLRVSADQGLPLAPGCSRLQNFVNTPRTISTAVQCNQIYTTVASNGRTYYIMAQADGTTGTLAACNGSPPPGCFDPENYSVNRVDNTTSWQLVSQVGYYSYQMDTNVSEMFFDQIDASYGFGMTDTLSGQNPVTGVYSNQNISAVASHGGLCRVTFATPNFDFYNAMPMNLERHGSNIITLCGIAGSPAACPDTTIDCFPATFINVGSGPVTSYGTIVPGTGYTNGTYNNVPLTGGSGSGATANIVVAGGVVSTITPISGGGGINFIAGDVVSAAAANLGGTGSGFSVPIATINITAANKADIQGTTFSGSYSGGTATMFGAKPAHFHCTNCLTNGMFLPMYNLLSGADVRIAKARGGPFCTAGNGGPNCSAGSVFASSLTTNAVLNFFGQLHVVDSFLSTDANGIAIDVEGGAGNVIANNQLTGNALDSIKLGSASSASTVIGNVVTGAPGIIATLGAITGGSGYTNGTYNNVPLSYVTSGGGYGASANVTVAGGVVTGVTLVLGGASFLVNDSLTVVASLIGGTGSGFHIPVATITNGNGVFVAAGATTYKILGPECSGVSGTCILDLAATPNLALGNNSLGDINGVEGGVANRIGTAPITVSALATCNAGAKGMRAFVTDSTAATYHTTVVGGGTNNVGVTCDGTNWYID